KKEMILNELCSYIADYCASKVSHHPDFNKLASKFCISLLHQSTESDFLNVITELYNNIDKNGVPSPIISDELYEIANKHQQEIQEHLNFERDYLFDYFGI